MDVSCPNLAAAARKIDPKYTGVNVAWNDGVRGVVDLYKKKGTPQLSCMGPRITDVRLLSEDNHVIPMVRPDNMDEWLGVLDPDCLVATPDGGTLKDFLGQLKQHVAYAGITLEPGSDTLLPAKVAIRMQEAFVGVRSGSERQVVPGHFSYQTSDADDPCNMMVVFTPTGWWVCVDGVGYKPLYANEVKEDGTTMVESWMEVKASDLAVGEAMSKKESNEPSTRKTFDDLSIKEEEKDKTMDEPASAFAGIGIKGSDPRLNRMVVVSIPLQQKPRPTYRGGGAKGPLSSMDCYDDDDDARVYRSCAVSFDEDQVPIGVARAAVLGAGKTVGEHPIKSLTLKLHPKDPVVVTHISFDTVTPHNDSSIVKVGDADVERAIKDMNGLYDLCEHQCRMSCLPAMHGAYGAEEQKKVQETLMINKKQKIAKAKQMAAKDPFVPLDDALLAFAE